MGKFFKKLAYYTQSQNFTQFQHTWSQLHTLEDAKAWLTEELGGRREQRERLRSVFVERTSLGSSPGTPRILQLAEPADAVANISVDLLHLHIQAPVLPRAQGHAAIGARDATQLAGEEPVASNSAGRAMLACLMDGAQHDGCDLIELVFCGPEEKWMKAADVETGLARLARVRQTVIESWAAGQSDYTFEEYVAWWADRIFSKTDMSHVLDYWQGHFEREHMHAATKAAIRNLEVLNTRASKKRRGVCVLEHSSPTCSEPMAEPSWPKPWSRYRLLSSRRSCSSGRNIDATGNRQSIGPRASWST